MNWRKTGSVLLSVSVSLWGLVARADQSLVRALLAGGERPVEVSVLESPKDIEDIVRRNQAALSKNPAWVQSYLKEHANERPLPWHENFGITKAEYERVLDVKNTVRLKKAADAKLRIRAEKGRLLLDTAGTFPLFDQLGAEVSRDGTAAVVLGQRLTEKHSVLPSDGQVVTGPWSGTCWKKIDMDKKSSVRLCLARQTEQKKGFLHFEARDAAKTPPPMNSEFFLFFALPKRGGK